MTPRVAVWLVALRTRRVPALEAVLSPNEQERARRFHRPVDVVRAVAAHGALRLALAPVLEVAAANVRFGVTAFGKPEIVWPERPAAHFSLSHCGDLTAIAISGDQHVGIDVECGESDAGALRRWVNHEALLKCSGYPGAPGSAGLGPIELSLGEHWVGTVAVGGGAAALTIRAAEIVGDGRWVAREFSSAWLDRVCPGPDAVLDVRSLVAPN